MKNELKNKSKITLATLKSFARKNANSLFTLCESSFSGMTDMVEKNKNEKFHRVENLDLTQKNDFGTKHGIYIVGGSNNWFTYYEDDHFYGIKITNCCGESILATPKNLKIAA